MTIRETNNKRSFAQFNEHQSLEKLSNEEPPIKILRIEEGIEEEPSEPTPFGTIIPPVIVYLRIIKPYFNTDEFLQFALVCRKHLEVLNFYWKERSRQEGLDGITWIKVDQDMLWVDNKLIANKSIDKFNYFFSSLLRKYASQRSLEGKQLSIISLRSKHFFKGFLMVIEAHKNYIRSKNSPLDQENLESELDNLRIDDLGELCLKTICASKEEKSNRLLEFLKNIPNKISPQQYKLLTVMLENCFHKGGNFFDTRTENYEDIRAENYVDIKVIEECLQICQEKENHWVAFFILDLLSQEKLMNIINNESWKENPMVLIKKLEFVFLGKIKVKEAELDFLISNYHSYKKIIQEDETTIEEKFLSYLTSSFDKYLKHVLPVTSKELVLSALKLYEHQLKAEKQKAAPLLIHAVAILLLSEENNEISTYPYLKQALQWPMQDFEGTFLALGVDPIKVKSILNEMPFEDGLETIQKELLQQVSECIKKNTSTSLLEASNILSKFRLEDIKSTEIAQSYKQLRYAFTIAQADQELKKKNPSLDSIEAMLAEIDVSALQEQTNILHYYRLLMRLSYKQNKYHESIKAFLKIRELEKSFSLNFSNCNDYYLAISCSIKLKKWNDVLDYFDIVDQILKTSNQPKDIHYYTLRLQFLLSNNSKLQNYPSIYKIFKKMNENGFNFLKLPLKIIEGILTSLYVFGKKDFFPFVELIQTAYTITQAPMLAQFFLTYEIEKGHYERAYVMGKQYLEIAQADNSLYKNPQVMQKILQNRYKVRELLLYIPNSIQNGEIRTFIGNLATFDEETKKIETIMIENS